MNELWFGEIPEFPNLPSNQSINQSINPTISTGLTQNEKTCIPDL